MFSLKRRSKTSTRRTVERVRFSDLPDDILIIIFSQCTIDELRTLRLTDSRSRSLIVEYISTIAPAAARSTFHQSRNLLLSRPLQYTFQWLEDLVPRQLAAILVDRHRMAHDSMQQRYGIPAEDPYGNELRARIANGWHVLSQLANISKGVHRSSASDPANPYSDFGIRFISPPRKLETSQQKEDLIATQRLAFIESMPAQGAKDYKLMFMLLSSAFRTSISNISEEHKPWVFDWGNGIDGQRMFRKGSSWLAWFVLAEGPELFWKQWWILPSDAPSTRHHIRDRAITAWTATPQKLVDYQRDHARRIQEAINVKAEVATDFISVNPIPYFTQYAEHRVAAWKSGMRPAEETMSHIPFHVEFRCPEEMLLQHKKLLEVEKNRMQQQRLQR
jgi:hypothetical protein